MISMNGSAYWEHTILQIVMHADFFSSVKHSLMNIFLCD